MSVACRRALVEELERVMLEFADFLRELPRDLYDAEVPGEEGSVRAILGHVVEAGYSHVSYVARHCGGREAEPRFPRPVRLDDAETWTAALLDVCRFARESLETVQDESLLTRFPSRWGQEYDGEQMLEHAICHPPRHARQLRKFLDGTL